MYMDFIHVGGKTAFFCKFQMNLDLSKSCFGPGNKLRWIKGCNGTYSGSGL